MVAMTRSGGPSRPSEDRSPGDEASEGGGALRLRTLLLLGVLVAGAAWFLLVRLAIGSGNRAQDGDAAGWVHLGLAGLAAVVALVVGTALLRELLVLLGVVRGYRPKRARSR
jgi:hypothetical protein